MGTSSNSAAAIVAAAKQAIADRGPGRLTLSAVAEMAGVSRPTLYRWFPTKRDLLAAVAADVEEEFYAGMQRVIDAQRAPARRLDAALRYLVLYLDGSTMGPDPIGTDPAFVLEGLRDAMSRQVGTVVQILGDALTQIPAVRAGAVSRAQAAELLLRLAYSHFLVPHPDPEVLLATIRSFAGVSGRAVTRSVGVAAPRSVGCS